MENKRGWSKKVYSGGGFHPNKAFKEKQILLNAMKDQAKKYKPQHCMFLERTFRESCFSFIIMKGFITPKELIVMDYSVDACGYKFAIMIDRDNTHDSFIEEEGYIVIHITKNQCYNLNLRDKILELDYKQRLASKGENKSEMRFIEARLNQLDKMFGDGGNV